MKIRYSLPNDGAFFNRYATLVPTLFKLGFLSQVVSALTEIGILYSLVYSGVKDFWPDYAPVIAVIGALIGTGLLEIGLRKFVPFSIKAILNKRFSGLDLVMSVFILGVTVGLLFSSGTLSFKGSKNMVEAIAPEPTQRHTVGIDSSYQASRKNTLESWRNDSMAIVTRYAGQIESHKDAWKSKINLEQENYKFYKAKEKSTGQSFGTKKQAIKRTISKLEADRDQALAGIQDAQAMELASAMDSRQKVLEEARNEWNGNKKEIKSFNEKEVVKAETKVNRYGGGLAWFTIFCLIVFVCSVILYEVHNKGAGIEVQTELAPYHFQQSVLSEFSQAVSNKWQQFARSKIQQIEMRTPAPPLPIAPAALYDYQSIEQPRLKIAYQDKDGESIIFLNPQQTNLKGKPPRSDLAGQAMEYIQAAHELESRNLTAAAREMEVKAEDVIKAYLGPEASPGNVMELKKAIHQYVFEKGENPFAHHHRRTIGFKSSKPVEPCVNNATVNASNTGSKMQPKNCLNCGQSYAPKVVWQKYCSEDCKLSHHAAKHGQRFNPGQYRKGKGK